MYSSQCRFLSVIKTLTAISVVLTDQHKTKKLFFVIYTFTLKPVSNYERWRKYMGDSHENYKFES